MLQFRRIPLLLLAALGLAGAAPAASFADATVDVTLWDKGASAEMATNMGMEDPGVDLTRANMGLTLSRSTVKAGPVTFKVVNSSKELVHEMVVLRGPMPGGALPYKAGDSKIDEDAAGHLGEVSELDPGKGGTLTLHLKPGKYVISCNVPGHYKSGMWAVLTVQ